MPKVVKGKPAQAPASSGLNMDWVLNGVGGGVAPSYYSGFAPAINTNVVWQDTTSNATYCSASAALGSTA